MKIEKPVYKEKDFAGVLGDVSEPQEFGSSWKVRLTIGETAVSLVGGVDNINKKIESFEIGDLVKVHCRENRYTSKKTGKEYNDWWVQTIELISDSAEVTKIQQENIDDQAEAEETDEQKTPKKEAIGKDLPKVPEDKPDAKRAEVYELQKISANADIEHIKSKLEYIDNTVSVVNGQCTSLLGWVADIKYLIHEDHEKTRKQIEHTLKELVKLITDLDHRQQDQIDTNYSELFKLVKGDKK